MEHTITVDLEKMTLGDLEMFETSSAVSITATLKVLEKFVSSDVPLKDLPVTSIRQIMDAVQAAITELQNPKN